MGGTKETTFEVPPGTLSLAQFKDKMQLSDDVIKKIKANYKCAR